MARVIDGDVKEIIDTSIDTTPFITAANLIVTDQLGSSAFSAAYLKEVERWLAAHFVAIRDKRAKSVTIGKSRADFSDKYGLGLDFTEYGQQVKVLDTTGTLANIGMRKAGFTVISECD